MPVTCLALLDFGTDNLSPLLNYADQDVTFLHQLSFLS